MPLCPVLTLGDEIRADAPLFIGTTTREFQAMITSEYHRLRGYAHEAGVHQMRLSVNIAMIFGPTPAEKGVSIQMVPQFVPAPQVSYAPVGMPSSHVPPSNTSPAVSPR